MRKETERLEARESRVGWVAAQNASVLQSLLGIFGTSEDGRKGDRDRRYSATTSGQTPPPGVLFGEHWLILRLGC
jgi:hypothetical protein